MLTHLNTFFRLIVPLKSVRSVQSFSKVSADTQFFTNFRENEKTVFACSYLAQVEFFFYKTVSKIS